MMRLAFLTMFVALVQAFDSWYRSRDIDVKEGELVERRLIAWGTCRSLSGDPRHDYRYFTLVLPFVRSWERDHCRDNSWGWAELAICRFAGKWRTYWMIR